MLLPALVLVPLLGALVAYLDRSAVRRSLWIVAGALIHLGLVALAWYLRPAPAGPGWLAFDPLGGLVLTLTSVVFLAVALYSVGYQRHEALRGGRAYASCLLVFLAADEERQDAQEPQARRDDKGPPAEAHPVDVGLREQVEHPDLFDPAHAYAGLEDHARDHNGREHRNAQADDHDQREALDFLGRQAHQEDDGRDDGQRGNRSSISASTIAGPTS